MAYLKFTNRERKTMFMTFEKESALKAGGGDFITETGCYVGRIQAKAITANSGALGVEFSIKTDEGLSGNFIKIYFQKADGTRINGGFNLLQGLMGILKIRELATPGPDQNGDHFLKEFHDQRVCFALQKRLYTKNDGSDGFGFELRAVAEADSLKTFRELSSGAEATKIKNLDESMTDIDERQAQPSHAQQPASAPMDDDDFGF